MKLGKPDPKKADKLEAKGDKLFAKGKYKKALEKFKKALEYDPDRTNLYDKLMQAHDQTSKEWEVGDFIDSVEWAMKKQEGENPAIKKVYAKLAPEWDEAKSLLLQIISASDENEIELFTKKLCSFGELGTRAAIDMLLDIKNAAGKSDEGEAADAPGESGEQK